VSRARPPLDTPESPEGDDPVRQRILDAAFKTFTAKGYAGSSTLEIATRAKVSKRDLYANFDTKEAVLVACIKGRTARMQLRPELPTPRSRRELVSILNVYAATLLRQVCHPTVVAMFRLAIAEAKRSPEIAQALETTGRDATRRTLTDLFDRAQAADLIAAGAASEMATQYLALLWEGLMVSMLLGLATAPTLEQIERRATKATTAFLQLYPQPSMRK
jgi:AcrR family transcriptional regulator